MILIVNNKVVTIERLWHSNWELRFKLLFLRRKSNACYIRAEIDDAQINFIKGSIETTKFDLRVATIRSSHRAPKDIVAWIFDALPEINRCHVKLWNVIVVSEFAAHVRFNFVVKARLPFDVLAIERKGVAAQGATVLADFAKLNFDGASIGIGDYKDVWVRVTTIVPEF